MMITNGQMSHEGRISYFDWIRGTIILWMLIYHISLNYGRVVFGVPEEGASVFTFMSFFMATFYVGTGYFFSCKKDFKSFIRDKAKKIGIPYLTFSIWGILIFELYNLIANGHWGDLNLIRGTIATGAIRANGPLWFLFSLFFCNIIYYLISKIGGGRLKNLIVIVCIMLAYLTHNRTQIFGYGNLLLGLSFIHLGYIIRQYKDTLNKWFLRIPAIFLFLGIAIFLPQRLEFVRNILVQGNWFLNYMYTVLGCFSMWYISQLWKHENVIGKGIIYLGRDSLVIFAFHRPVLNWVVEPIIRYLNPNISYVEFLAFSLICLILLYLLLNYILRQYFPVLIGLSAKKSLV